MYNCESTNSIIENTNDREDVGQFFLNLRPTDGTRVYLLLNKMTDLW